MEEKFKNVILKFGLDQSIMSVDKLYFSKNGVRKKSVNFVLTLDKKISW